MHRLGRVRHGFQEPVVVGGPDLLHLARAVDIRLAVAGGHADGQLFQCAAVAAHGVPLEMGQHQHGIVLRQIFAHKILLNDLAVRDGQLHVRAFRVQQVHLEPVAPAVGGQGFPVLFGGVALPVIGGVAFHHGAAHRLNGGFPEFRAQEVLVAHLAGMQLDGHIAGQFLAGEPVQLQYLFRCDGAGKKHLCVHECILLVCYSVFQK